MFQSVLWALQRQLPVEEEPLLAQEHWEFLYARSIGCIGLLKLHLNRALNRALKEGAHTVTLDHLRQTAMSDVRVRLALRNALESEAEFVEEEDADEQLLALLGRSSSHASVQSKTTPGSGDQTQKKSPKRRPGKRAEGRDPTGQESDNEATGSETREEQAAG